MKKWLKRIFHIHRRDISISWMYQPAEYECRCGKKMGGGSR